MNKSKLLFAVVIGLVFAEGAGLLYAGYRSQQLSKALKSIKPGFEQLTVKEKEDSDKYAELVKQYESVKEDRSNLTAQIKRLTQEQGSIKELEGVIAELKKEKEGTDNNNAALKKEVGTLRASQERLTKERKDLIAANKKLIKTAALSELRRKNVALQKDSRTLSGTLNKKDNTIKKFRQDIDKAKVEKTELASRIKDLEKKYTDAVKKNKRLEGDIRNMPQKFSEIARQNKLLSKETAKMHYNLGVFYTKNKEYDRAAMEFKKVIDIDPNDAYAHFNLGYIYAEYIVNRDKAVAEFRQYLLLAKSDDKDVDWVKRYILTWDTYDGKVPMR